MTEAPEPPRRPTRRSARPPWYLVGSGLAAAAAILLHGPVYETWYVWEITLAVCAAATVLGVIGWIMRAFDADRPHLAIVLVGGAIGLVSAWLGAGSPVYPVVVGTTCLFLLPLAVLAFLMQLAFGRRGASAGFGALALACLLQVPAGLLADVIRVHDENAAIHWCDDQLIPAILAYETENDSWPYDLDAAGIITGRRPRLLGGHRFWKVRKEGTELRLSVRSRRFYDPPAGFFEATEVYWRTNMRQWIPSNL